MISSELVLSHTPTSVSARITHTKAESKMRSLQRNTSNSRARSRSLASILGLATFCLLLLLARTASADQSEPRTGIAFEDKIHRQSLQKLGVRTKGPIKVYAVGQYGKNLFVLKMAFNVKAEQLSEALMDALKPRCESLGCEKGQVKEFKTFVMSALPNGAKKGTVLMFNTASGKIALTVNGKAAGKMPGKALASAFAGIYTDSKAVCKMYSVKSEDGSNERIFRDDPEMTRAAGVMALATVIIVLSFTKPDTKVKVSELNIYPIKSCAEQSVESALVTPTGFEGDRVAMVVDSHGICCTPRKTSSRLFHVTPTIDMNQEIITLSSRHSNDTLGVDLSKAVETIKATHNDAPGKLTLADCGNLAASWLETVTGIKGCRLVGINEEYKRSVLVNKDQGDEVPIPDAPVSLADEAPFLLCNEASLEDLNRRMDERDKSLVDMRRFRPNIVVKNLVPWEEDTWSKIRIGTVEFFVWQRCGRCIMTTFDRDTLDRTSEPLATLSTFRERAHGMRNFGMHLIPDPATLGDNPEVSLGDEIEVLQYDEERRKEWLATKLSSE